MSKFGQNYMPAIEGNARQAAELQKQLVKYFGCRFEHLFEVVTMIAPKQ